MSPTIIQIHEPTAGRAGRMLNKIWRNLPTSRRSLGLVRADGGKLRALFGSKTVRKAPVGCQTGSSKKF
jgi:hypothetical protein